MMPLTNDDVTYDRKEKGSESKLKRAREEKAFSGVKGSPVKAVKVPKL